MKNGIIEKTDYYLGELSPLTLVFPLTERINVLSRLKALKRTGKAIRLEQFGERVKIRTVYDHMQSLIRFAAEMLAFPEHAVYGTDTLARLIAYHEINEVLVGDIPRFSVLKKTSYEFLDDERVKGISKAEREIIASKFIKIFANAEQRKSIDVNVYAMENPADKTAKFFEFIDTLDPIVCVWRYLCAYRSDVVFARKMVDALTDYFIYPHTLDFKDDPDYPFAREIIDNLCNKDNALKYVAGESFENSTAFGRYLMPIKTLVEQTPLYFD